MTHDSHDDTPTERHETGSESGTASIVRDPAARPARRDAEDSDWDAAAARAAAADWEEKENGTDDGGEAASAAGSEEPDAAWTGGEPTMADGPVAAWDGAERTLADTAGTAWAGDERTLADTPAPIAGTVGTWVGDERTMADAPARDAGYWSGDEQTIVPRPDSAPPAGEEPWIGQERTKADDTDLAGARAAKARAVREAREAKEASAKSDGLWHLAGREGPCTGQQWGDYEVGAVLGEGGMGVVYKGRQTSLNRRVAIKVLPPAMAHDPTLRERFEMESRTASLLQSPHVVQVFTAGSQADNLYFVMEYVEGRELSEVIRESWGAGGRLPPYEAGEFIIQAARGLMEAQRHNIVHRDIKPANLMVTSDGLVKIADFGIVKVVGEHTLTMTGTAVGTPSYVSPEQGRGDQTDARSDLYSLGVVFYELLTGERPFKGSSPNALIYQHSYTEPTLPSELVSDIPEDYEKVVIKCLQKDPDQRYADAGALVQDLERIQIGHSPMVAVFAGKIGTGADAAMRANMNWLQRHFWAVAAALLA
ncbi:MAG: serine/threonine-protein kinase, partial [Planctomycetota bacterium]